LVQLSGVKRPFAFVQFRSFLGNILTIPKYSERFLRDLSAGGLFGSPMMSSLYFLMNAIAVVLAGLAIIYIVSKIWGWLFRKHGGDRE